MDNVGVTVGATLAVKPFDVTDCGLAQASDEISVQVTTSPFWNDVLLSVVPVPAGEPFTVH